MSYRIIYADPPWEWKARSPKGEGRSARNHYDLMTLQQIKELPVASIADDDSVLFLWAIDPMLEEAFDVIKAWGFTYKTVGFYWMKTNNQPDSYFTGMGYYTRANPEQCLLATRGNGLVRISKSIKKLVISQRMRHSQKPDEVAQRIEELYGDVSRVELFARRQRPGWNVWGNQVVSNVTLMA